jgi:CheY-like chemotaxis protein
LARIVLLADDSVTAQNMGRRIMTDAGYEVITVNNGSAALKKIHESHPDLIVLDVYMPGYGGLEVCQRLKESEATMKIPVLLTVGKMEPFKTEEAKRVHADGHIIKPFDASELLAALTRLEDKIVPSENARGRRGKAETGAKRSRNAAAADPAATFDDSHTEQIQYLARAKQLRPVDEVPEAPDSPFAQPPTNATPTIDDPEATVEMPAVVETSSYEPPTAYEPPAATVVPEEGDHAVTFASGPIYEPELRASAPAVTASPEEFEIQPDVEVDSQAEPSADMSSASSAPPDIDKVSTPVFSITETETVAGLDVEPGLVPEGAASDFSPSPQAEPAQRWIAENVVPTSEEAAHSLEEEMDQAHVVNEPAASEAQSSQDSAAEPTPAPETERQSQSVPETDSGSGAAFAAAASASESFAHTNAVSASNSDSEPPAGSQSSAAWDNWQRIRDTVITDRATEAIAESAAAMADAAVSPQNEARAAQPTPDAAPSQQASSNDALSNIVDSVLAELKPRLLAEIAKQLAQDKK